MPDAEKLLTAALNNPDGFGFALIERTRTGKEQLVIRRSMDPDYLIMEFMRARTAHPRGPAMFHCRIGTSGRLGIENCHPFRVGKDPNTVLAHNGVLFRPGREEPRSDTKIFAMEVFPSLYRKPDSVPVRQKLERALIGNKVALLTTNPRYRHQLYIFGEERGDWIADGSWQSNSSWRWGKYSSSRYPARTPSRGRVSYDGGKTWQDDEQPRRRQGKGTKYKFCKYCHTPQVVNPYTNICTNCRICNDCGEWAVKCDCEIRPLNLQGARR